MARTKGGGTKQKQKGPPFGENMIAVAVKGGNV